MHLGTIINKKLNRLDPELIGVYFLTLILILIAVFLISIVIVAGFNSTQKRNLERKSHDIQITNTK